MKPVFLPMSSGSIANANVRQTIRLTPMAHGDIIYDTVTETYGYIFVEATKIVFAESGSQSLGGAVIGFYDRAFESFLHGGNFPWAARDI